MARWKLILILSLLGFAFAAQSQQKADTLSKRTWSEKVNQNKQVKMFLGAITREPEPDTVFILKSEDPYLRYAGKIIRRIIIKRVGFESTVLDTTRRMQTFISNTANNLHVNTKEFVIRNNLFIKEGKPLNPYRVADNERTLRNLGFVLDARILVKPISKKSDSVDLIVMTRDVFSLGVAFDPQTASRYKLIVTEINVAGMGQKIQVGALYDMDRTPNFGYDLLYQKGNVGGSFIDASLGYSKIDGGISIGNENENGIYFKLNRPLFQPFTRWAGGLELSHNESINVYKKPDSVFSSYRYDIQDLWMGYSFGNKNLPKNLRENRNRKFLAVRRFQQNFSELPTTLLNETNRYLYRTRTMVLTQLTFFKQDFYKTQYVLGFGRTEDVPYGYRLSFTGGWEEELENRRPYLGTELYYNKVRPNGTILTYAVKAGGYMNNGINEDGLAAFNFTRFSKIYSTGRVKIRHQFETGYARLFNQKIKQGINIREVNGITGFRPDSLVGTQRITLSEEATVFTPWKVLGFKLAPVSRIDLAFINQKKELFDTENFFSGFSAGMKARNENLIFNTIEMRLFYFPKTVANVDHFTFVISTNVKIKYPSNLVNPPSTVFN